VSRVGEDVMAMMYGGVGHGGGLILLLASLLWVALIVLIVWLVTKVWPGLGDSQAGPPVARPVSSGAAGETPEQILDRMFAVGEIDEATYRARRTALAEMKAQQP
jgi:putative membrane protein